jgi:hypothetical protein
VYNASAAALHDTKCPIQAIDPAERFCRDPAAQATVMAPIEEMVA